MQQLITFKCLGSVFKIFVFFLVLYFPSQLSGQGIVNGRVSDLNGRPLSDITVSALPTGSMTKTDSLGSFQLLLDSITANQQLVFSAIGYRSVTKHLAVTESNQYFMQVQLEQDFLRLDEVIVTGTFLETSRKKLGNSISTIHASQLSYTGTGNLSAMLSGKILGGYVMQNSGDPAGGFSLKLRGVSSIYGSSEPLYLLDGVVIDNRSVNVANLYLNQGASQEKFDVGTNRLADIDPHDIDHIEVINGPAAAAIYGSRAASGVVQLFSKKGVKGKLAITFSTSLNFNSVAKKIDYNSAPYRFGIKKTEGLTAPDESRTTVVNRRSDTAIAYGPVAFNGKKLDTTRYGVKRYDYQDNIFQPAWGTDQHIAVSNGWGKGSIYAAASFLKNNGIVVGTDFQRYGLKFKADYQPYSFIKVAGGLAYSNSRTTEKTNSGLQFSTMASINHIDNVYDIHKRDDQGNLKSVEFGWVNPLSTLEGNEIKTETTRTIADISLRATPWRGLIISASIGLDNYNQQGFTFQERLPYYQNGNVGLNLFPDGYVSLANLNYYQWTGDLSVAFTKHISSKISTATVAGYSGQYYKNVFHTQEGRDLLPFARNINAAQNFFIAPVDERAEQTVYGYYLQETIGYNDKAFLTLGGRFDGSSAFGSQAGNIFYPRASVSYNLSEYDWWKNSAIHTWFNTWQLRAAYGKAGNLTGIGPYDRFNNYPPVNYYAGGIVPQNRQGNEAIRPEVKTEWEAGADLQFFNSRLYLRLTIYHQNINDLVLAYNWAPSNGSSSVLGNVGSMQNKGIELNLGGILLQKKTFNWEASLLFNRNKNVVTKTNTNAGFVGLDFQNTQGILPGYPMGMYYGFYYARSADGALLLKNNNGFLLPQVERGDAVTGKPGRDAQGQPVGSPLRKVLGDPNPDYTMSLTNDIRFKEWRLHIQVDRMAGFEVFNWAAIIRNNIGNGKYPERELTGELPRGWSAALGGFMGGPIVHEEFVEDGSFIKLREIALSYQLTGMKRINSMEFIMSGHNIFTISNYGGYDPESNSAGQSILRGLDFSSAPIPRTLQFSIITRF